MTLTIASLFNLQQNTPPADLPKLPESPQFWMPKASSTVAGQIDWLFEVMVWISADFSRGAGFWVDPRPRLGMAALVWSYLYFAGMIVRYVIRMARRPDQRWLGGTIPIIFHMVVAAFQWTFGTYHVAPPT